MKQKNWIISFFIVSILLVVTSCNKDNPLQLADSEVIKGLKEALKIGTENSVQIANNVDGYFNDTRIRIPFPEDAVAMKDALIGAGMTALVDDFVLKLNRSAEDAADEAQPIFLNSIENLTINDGMSILLGADDAATQYLKVNTYDDMKDVFSTDIDNSLNGTGADQAWTIATNAYNALPGSDPVNTDLTDYTTRKALDGLYVLVADEEAKIRTDPSARVNDLLSTVFSILD